MNLVKRYLFDLHLDLEVYFNKNLRGLLNMPYLTLNKASLQRHFDIVQARKVNLKYMVVQVQSLRWESTYEKITPLTDINEFLCNFKNFLNRLRKYPTFRLIKNYNDLRKISDGQIGIFLGVEGLNFVDSYEDIEVLWKLGFRVFGLTWNFANKIAGGLTTENRLTDLGKKIVGFIVNNGGIIDCAHLNEQSFFDVLKIAENNFIFSHNNLSSIISFRQNLSEKILRKIANKRTLVGLTLLPPSLGDEPTFTNWLANYHKLRQINPKLLAIGTDYFGFDFRHSPLGAENYENFVKNLEKFKVNKQRIFLNTLNYFLDKIKKW
ncbi:MAG: membrane dipeptidase [Patescibacteria group bacterium]|nr:membrane dipeptidase [Patescibacteria group bacterium]